MSASETRTASITANVGLFNIRGFDHLEFTTSDAHSTSQLLKFNFGMKVTARSGRETHNYVYSSVVLESHDIKFVVTAPYMVDLVEQEANLHKQPNPTYNAEKARHFFTTHGTGVNAIGILVDDVAEAFRISTSRGARAITEPTTINDHASEGKVIIAEILIYDDENPDDIHNYMPDLYKGIATPQSNTVLRFVQRVNFEGTFLPGYKKVVDPKPLDYGLLKMDHVVGNVYRMSKVVDDLKNWLGFHTFAFFTPEEIRTKWTSLNSEVVANDDARVLMPINETAPGKKESQILKYLRAYNGPGVQHIAIKTFNIFETMDKISNASFSVDFLPTLDSYYERPEVKERIQTLQSEGTNPFASVEELTQNLKKHQILIDKDETGTLLQIFTKPLFDRPTIFVELIQRICAQPKEEIPGCGKFGQGNFKALFETLEVFFDGDAPQSPATNSSSSD